MQNYPNPFNPTTQIKFSIAEASDVKITIYDALGRVVDVLVDAKMYAGQHSVVWDAARNASGIYFYKMEAGQYTSMRKMLLIH